MSQSARANLADVAVQHRSNWKPAKTHGAWPEFFQLFRRCNVRISSLCARSLQPSLVVATHILSWTVVWPTTKRLSSLLGTEIDQRELANMHARLRMCLFGLASARLADFK